MRVSKRMTSKEDRYKQRRDGKQERGKKRREEDESAGRGFAKRASERLWAPGHRARCKKAHR